MATNIQDVDARHKAGHDEGETAIPRKLIDVSNPPKNDLATLPAVIGCCHIEKLPDLEAFPANGFSASCFPVKVGGDCARWTRAVAIIDA
jgi:hypothetical protein